MTALMNALRICLLAGVVISVADRAALADTILTASSLESNQLVSVDITTNTVTTITNTSVFNSGPDSLIFDGKQIIYTLFSSGQLGEFNPAADTNTIVAGGFSQPRDLTLEPGGVSVLVSDTAGNAIYRVNLSTGSVTTLLTGGSPQGLAYDNKGNLFAVIGGAIVQVDPKTGAILKSTGVFNAGNIDGLTFDSFSGKLWATSGISAIYEVPTNLSGETAFAPGFPPVLDGIEGDGKGNLFIASRSDYHIYEYNIASNTLSQKTQIFGLDDLAPVTGSGAPPPTVPEPASWLLLGSGLTGFVVLYWSKLRFGSEGGGGSR